ncbi:MAG: glycosyltransferase family 87 protein [Terriglobales bacterium]
MGHKLNHAAVWFLAAMILLQGWVFWSVRGKVLSGYADFTAFYTAGKLVRQGQGSRLYDPQEQWRVQQEFAKDVAIRQGPLPYLRLPFEALLFVPFALLPYSTAYVSWLLLNLGVVIAVVLFLRRQLGPLQEFPAWLPVLVALAFTPVFLALLQGQDSILLLLFYSLAYVSLREGVDFRAGCWLGLGLIKPHLVLPFVAIAFLRGNRKLAGGFILVAIVLLVVSVGVVGWSGFLHYPGYLWELERHTERGLVQPRDNPNLRGLVEGFGSGLASSDVITCAIAILSLGLMLWVYARNRKKAIDGRIANLVFCQMVIASLLVSYHAFAYDLSLLLLPIFLLMMEWGDRSLSFARWALFSPVALLLCGPIFPLLWLRWHALSLIAIVLLVWMWGLDRRMARVQADCEQASS